MSSPSNIFGIKTQDDSINRSVIETRQYAVGRAKVPTNTDVLEALRQLITGQTELHDRLQQIEGNQTIIQQNQRTLSEGLASIVHNQTVMSDRISAIDIKIVEKAEMLAQNKTTRECKVLLKKIEESVCRMTGEIQDSGMDDVASTLPLQSQLAISEMEEKLQSPDYAQTMTTYMHRIKGGSEDVATVMRNIFSDHVLKEFNWDGRWDKKSFCKLIIVDTILRNVFKKQGARNFELSMKKSLLLSHHRSKQRAYLRNKNKTTKK